MLKISVQAEETRLLDTQTRQFADKNRVGSQPRWVILFRHLVSC